MKTFFIPNTLFLLFFTLNLNSQSTTFEYLLSTPSDEFVFDIYETEDNDILFCGSEAPTTNRYNRSLLLVKLDSFGNLIDSVVYSLYGRSIFAKQLLVSGTNNFIIVSMIHDTVNTRNETALGLYNFNLDLTLSNETIYNFDSIYIFENVAASILSNSNILASVSLRIHPQFPRAYSYEFSSNFDSLRALYYSEGPRIISHIHELPDNNIWTLNMLRDRYELLDSSLNIIATQKVPHIITSNFGIAWDSDTSFYLLGDGMNYNLEYYHNLSYIRQFHPIDTTGHIYNYWRDTDTVDFPAVWNGIDFKNKDSIFIGGTRNMWASYYLSIPSWFVILQTDSMLNVRWERFYGGDAYYMMGKLIATNDGGCLVAGTRYDYLNVTEQETDIIILKLNNEGLLTGIRDKPVIEMHEAIVYPNPGNEVIKIRIAAQYKQSVFELFDINGRHILTQNFTGTHGTVNVAFLEHGTYIYRITSNDGLFESGKWVKQ